MNEPSLFEGGSLVTAAIRRIRDHIRTNELRVGDVLPGEQYFAGELGVSRAVTREAFGALAALKLLDVGNGRRARVGAIDGSVMATSLDHAITTEQASIVEIWDVRRTIELRTAELAASNRTHEEASRVIELAQAIAGANGLDQIVENDIQFHQAIAAASHNAVFQHIFTSFESIMRTAVPAAWHTRITREQRDKVCRNHLELAEAISAGDPAAALKAMNNHFDESVIRAAGIAGL